VKIYVAAVEALRKKERQDETQFTTKVDSFLRLFSMFFLLYSLMSILTTIALEKSPLE
jgi:hypothetical protein